MRKGSSDTIGQVMRFATVGVANTVVYAALYRLLLWGGIHYAAAVTIAFSIAVVFSFFMNCRFTYGVRPTWRRFFLFPLSTLLNFFLTLGGAVLLVEGTRLSEFWSGTLASLAAIPFTFLLARYLLTGAHHREDQPAGATPG